MKLSTQYRNWWVILIQGITLILLGFIIFNNPDTALAAIAFWLGIVVIFIGLIGVIAWFGSGKEDQDILALFGSISICLIGLLMLSKMFVTMKAITLVFGAMVAIVGLVLITGSWNGRRRWSLWWIIALLGFGALFLGLKSAIDIYSGAQTISNLIGTAIFVSGIGLVCLAALKKRIAIAISNKLT